MICPPLLLDTWHSPDYEINFYTTALGLPMYSPPEIEDVYGAVGQFVVFFQMVEDTYRNIGWLLVDPERKNWPPLEFRRESNRELIDKVTDRFLALIATCNFPNGTEWAAEAQSLRKQFHELRKYRNRLLHSAYTTVVAGGEVVTVLRTSPKLNIDPDTGEIIADQEDFSPDLVRNVISLHAASAFKLHSMTVQLLHWASFNHYQRHT